MKTASVSQPPGKPKIDLRGLLTRMDHLPGLSAAVQKVCNLAAVPNASADDLAALIQYDPVLSRKTLRIANSAFYGLTHEVSSVKEAVVLLGLTTVRSLAIATSALNVFDASDTEHFRQEQFWLHSAACAVLAHRIVRLTRVPGTSDAFTAALLHDIGKLVLHQSARDAFSTLLALQAADRFLSTGTERTLTGISHSELGKALAAKWKLPLKICESIGAHHGDGHSGTSYLAAVCCIADYICSRSGLGSVVDVGIPPFPKWALSKVRISSSVIEELRCTFGQIRSEAQAVVAV